MNKIWVYIVRNIYSSPWLASWLVGWLSCLSRKDFNVRRHEVQTFQLNSFIPAMLLDTIYLHNFIPLSVALTFAEGHKVSRTCWLHFLTHFLIGQGEIWCGVELLQVKHPELLQVNILMLSDHFVISFDLLLRKPGRVTKKVTSRNIRSVDMYAFRTDLRNVLESATQSESADPPSVYNTCLRQALDHHAPLVTRTVTDRTSAPWMTGSETGQGWAAYCRT